MPRHDRPTSSQANAATFLALAAMIVLGLALLGLAAVVLPGLLAIFLLLVLFAVPAAFHYLVWGWFLSRGRQRDGEGHDD